MGVWRDAPAVPVPCRTTEMQRQRGCWRHATAWTNDPSRGSRGTILTAPRSTITSLRVIPERDSRRKSGRVTVSATWPGEGPQEASLRRPAAYRPVKAIPLNFCSEYNRTRKYSIAGVHRARNAAAWMSALMPSQWHMRCSRQAVFPCHARIA